MELAATRESKVKVSPLRTMSMSMSMCVCACACACASLRASAADSGGGARVQAAEGRVAGRINSPAGHSTRAIDSGRPMGCGAA